MKSPLKFSNFEILSILLLLLLELDYLSLILGLLLLELDLLTIYLDLSNFSWNNWKYYIINYKNMNYCKKNSKY